MTNGKRYLQTWTAERNETREAFRSCMQIFTALCVLLSFLFSTHCTQSFYIYAVSRPRTTNSDHVLPLPPLFFC